MSVPRPNKKITVRRVITVLILLTVAGELYSLWLDYFPAEGPRYWRYHTLITDIGDNNFSRVKADLDGGTDPNDFPPAAVELPGIAPLDAAVVSGQIPMVQMLLDHHADVNIDNSLDGSPLSEAVHNENIPMMKFLIAHGAVVNDDGIGGSDILCTAAMDNKIDVVKCLLANKANPNTLNCKEPRESLLHAVKAARFTSIGKLLRKAGAKG
jgi:hypothetical protein